MSNNTKPTRMPTHRAAYVGRSGKERWPVEIHIYPSVLEKLAAGHDGAQKSVAIAYRKVCEKQHADFRLSYVAWDDIVVTPLLDENLDDEPFYELTESGDVVDCDECSVCEIGDHEYCRGACPQVFSLH